MEARLISSLEKVFLDSPVSGFREYSQAYAYLDSAPSLGIMTAAGGQDPHRQFARVEVEGIPAECVRARRVELIPSAMPVYPGKYDAGYLRTVPGLYPDLLSDPENEGAFPVFAGQSRAIWIDIDMSKMPKEIIAAGRADILFRVRAGADEAALPFTLFIIPAKLPEQSIRVTQWFHTDSLADWYGVPVFSEDYWRITENFMRTAAENGINTILTPTFTPPLDTHVGGERTTVQLVGVKLGANGRYYFDYSLLDRWIDLCDKVGIVYFEIAHLFTQWGAKHAPKVMARTPDGYRKIFGWETDACGKEYVRFLREYLKTLIKHMKERGDDRRMIFHISDEPNAEQLEQYLAARSSVIDLLEGYTVTDALSNVNFYLAGAVTTPIPSNNHIEPFIRAFEEEGREGLWTYYCCGQSVGVSNRFFAMPGARTRFIGCQFYKYKIAGFLQWGYNFYYNQGSYNLINPFFETTGSGFVPSGDAFSVYPGPGGECLESIRIRHFRQALEDLRALRLCESFYGRERTLAELEKICGKIVFSRCVNDSGKMEEARKRIDELNAKAVRG
ncbi:MAG: DUF4091 domain-containing protein, partial [Clostridia bacterium]|nr:DUF4091 domain-containing protein [Clostridia bacterium]